MEMRVRTKEVSQGHTDLQVRNNNRCSLYLSWVSVFIDRTNVGSIYAQGSILSWVGLDGF